MSHSSKSSLLAGSKLLAVFWVGMVKILTWHFALDFGTSQKRDVCSLARTNISTEYKVVFGWSRQNFYGSPRRPSTTAKAVWQTSDTSQMFQIVKSFSLLLVPEVASQRFFGVPEEFLSRPPL